jgi:hypothetical protein
MEQLSVYDGVSISLREMDQTIAAQNYLKEFYLSPLYSPTNATNDATHFMDEWKAEYNRPIWDALPSTEPSSWSVISGFYDDMIEEFEHDALVSVLLTMFGGGFTSPYDGGVVQAMAEDYVKTHWDQYAQRMSNSVPVPEPCREVMYFTFEKYPKPEVERYVKIRSIPGVTSVPEADVLHYVPGHGDFTFTLTFPGDALLKVVATGTYSRIVNELSPTALGDGRYSYLIRQVVEPWTIDILNEPASGPVGNEIAAGGCVWTYGNTLYIESPTACRAGVYTLSGALARQLNVSPGQTRVQLERGLYIVELNGTHYKVIVK